MQNFTFWKQKKKKKIETLEIAGIWSFEFSKTKFPWDIKVAILWNSILAGVDRRQFWSLFPPATTSVTNTDRWKHSVLLKVNETCMPYNVLTFDMSYGKISECSNQLLLYLHTTSSHRQF